jgi:plasmid stabilization system protein ParE
MVERLIWSKEARKAMSEIFAYWNNRNRSKAYSKKLYGFFIEQGKLLVRFPLHGREIGVKNLRAVVVKDYELVYQLVPDGVRVVAVWDTRQNPEKLTELLKKDL